VTAAAARIPQTFSLAATEALRASWRPAQITTLFVGESAPASGEFFYDGNNSMVRYMSRALSVPEDQLLDRFKAYGWYLDDLVLHPINRMTQAERRAAWVASTPSLRDRVAGYRPSAIVTLLKGMEKVVESAASGSGHICPVYAVSFPGMGQQARFQMEMAALSPRLPRL
jgi:hypothetical protein